VDGAVRNLSKKRASRTRLCLHGQQQAPPNRLSHRLCCLGKSIYSFRANEMFGSGDGVEPSHPDDAGKHMAKVAFLIRARSVGSSPPRPTINLQYLCGNSHFCFSSGVSHKAFLSTICQLFDWPNYTNLRLGLRPLLPSTVVC
jgi:hypothetical protein